MSQEKFQRELSVTQHKTVEKSGEAPVYEVTLKSVMKDEATRTALIVKISTESDGVFDKFGKEEKFVLSLHKQPKL